MTAYSVPVIIVLSSCDVYAFVKAVVTLCVNCSDLVCQL